MAKSLRQWVVEDVDPVKDEDLQWLSEVHFFRDPTRPIYTDDGYMFAPADGIILYQNLLQPDEPVVDIKGVPYSLQQAMRDPHYDRESLVIGIFMTLFDPHINRIPYAGYLSYKQLDPISSYNYPMLEVEKDLVERDVIRHENLGYLHNNERMLNRIYAPDLQLTYYVLQIADYDVDCVAPFEVRQNQPVAQNERFSMIRFGSQVDLIVPTSPQFDYELLQETGYHVEAGVDPLIKLFRKDAGHAGVSQAGSAD